MQGSAVHAVLVCMKMHVTNAHYLADSVANSSADFFALCLASQRKSQSTFHHQTEIKTKFLKISNRKMGKIREIFCFTNLHKATTLLLVLYIIEAIFMVTFLLLPDEYTNRRAMEILLMDFKMASAIAISTFVVLLGKLYLNKF